MPKDYCYTIISVYLLSLSLEAKAGAFHVQQNENVIYITPLLTALGG
jgi:hypothetical protein